MKTYRGLIETKKISECLEQNSSQPKYLEQAEAELVPSSSLVDVEVEVDVWVDVEVGVEVEFGGAKYEIV